MPTKTQIVNGVDFVALPTKDWEAARKFYEDVARPAIRQAVGRHARRRVRDRAA